MSVTRAAVYSEEMYRALILVLATTILADVAADNGFDAVSNDAAPDATREALRRLFDKYGGRDSGRLTFEGFEHLFESLGLGHVVMVDHDVHDHQTDDGRFRSLHDDHVHHTGAHRRSSYHDEHAGVDTCHPVTTASDDQQRRRKRSADSSDISQVRIVVYSTLSRGSVQP